MADTTIQAVSDTELGLTSEEIQLLRHAQQTISFESGASQSSGSPSEAASSGLLILDATSLALLGRHFDRVMLRMQQQLEYLTEQARIVTMEVYDEFGNLIDDADAKIAKYSDISRQIDELELDFDRIAHIRDLVRDFRNRAEELEKELDSQPLPISDASIPKPSAQETDTKPVTSTAAAEQRGGSPRGWLCCHCFRGPYTLQHAAHPQQTKCRVYQERSTPPFETPYGQGTLPTDLIRQILPSDEPVYLTCRLELHSQAHNRLGPNNIQITAIDESHSQNWEKGNIIIHHEPQIPPHFWDASEIHPRKAFALEQESLPHRLKGCLGRLLTLFRDTVDKTTWETCLVELDLKELKSVSRPYILAFYKSRPGNLAKGHNHSSLTHPPRDRYQGQTLTDDASIASASCSQKNYSSPSAIDDMLLSEKSVSTEPTSVDYSSSRVPVAETTGGTHPIDVGMSMKRSTLTFYKYEEQPEIAHPGTREDDLESIVSAPDDIGSLAESDGTGPAYREAAIDFLVKTFTDDTDLLTLYQGAVQMVGESKFIRNHRRLLKVFYLGLIQLDQNPQQKLAAQLFRRRSERTSISAAIYRVVCPSETTLQEKIDVMLENGKDTLSLLDRFLSAEGDLDYCHQQGSRSESQSDSEDDDNGPFTDKLSNVISAADFLTTGQPYKTYKKSLDWFLHPQESAGIKSGQTTDEESLHEESLAVEKTQEGVNAINSFDPEYRTPGPDDLLSSLTSFFIALNLLWLSYIHLQYVRLSRGLPLHDDKEGVARVATPKKYLPSRILRWAKKRMRPGVQDGYKRVEWVCVSICKSNIGWKN